MKLISNLILGLFFMSITAQERVSDTCYIANHKFMLSEKNGIAKLEAFLNDEKIPISNTIKMPPPVYFVRKGKMDNILSDDIFVDNGDIVKVFLLVGNEAPECVKEGMNLKYKDDFCGINVQGVVISPDGIEITNLVSGGGLACLRENVLSMKDLYTFAHSKPEKNPKKIE